MRARGAPVAVMVFLGLTFAGATTTAAADDWAVVPEGVTRSLGAGGAASTEASLLGEPTPATGPSPDPADYTYGPPLRLLVWEPWDEVAGPGPAAADTLTVRDVSIVVGSRWVAVQYLEGDPHATLEVDGDGDFVALGSHLEADVEALAEVTPGTVLLGAGMLGGLDEFYEVSDDRRSVTALNAAARARIGPEPMSVSEFRDIKARQRSAVLAAESDDLPPDAVGAEAAVGGSDSTAPAAHSTGDSYARLGLAVIASVAGAVMLFFGGVLVGRRLRGRTS